MAFGRNFNSGELMGTLRDEAYEQLDYLSQLTEVVVGPQNEALAEIPDRIELDFEKISRLKRTRWGGTQQLQIDVSSIINEYCSTFHIVSDITQNFEFQCSEDCEIDFVNKTMTGSITLVKKVHQVDEKKLLELAVDSSRRVLGYYDWPTKRLKDKVVTVLNTLIPNSGNEWVKQVQGRVGPQAGRIIADTISTVILENKWRIRDAGVILKMGQWINSYLADDTDTSTGLVNLIKLKIMVDKDLPIYSVDEVKSV